ncbi:DUF7572 family protein [Corynebacterium glutamicum]|uniref:DUF7572 family protein n=1 Tax=Corynebacterium glutamicum TaxID=1718 RepID=UPI001468C235|nr:hypothetical protein [Corynebacterium glutamicum]GFK19303.1 hypothetical protein KbCgl_18750 [Corynebacterium glutamicum]
MPKIIDSTRTGAATFLQETQGRFGKVRHWKISDGTYVITSSAHHYPNDVLVMAREITGDLPHENGLVSETAVFASNEAGDITDWGGIAKIYIAESHEEVMKLAGFTLTGDSDV